MKKALKNILDWLELKVNYADLRFIQTEEENIKAENGILSFYNVSTNRGVGIRVLVNGAWGFAASNNLSRTSLLETANTALKIAQASALVKKGEVKLAPEKKHLATYITPIIKDPFQVSPSEKIDLLVKVTKAMLKDKVKKSNGSLEFIKSYKIFISTDGSEIEQTIIVSGGGIIASAIGEVDFQKRSYPSGLGGDYATCGYELIEEMKLTENAERISEEANQLLTAPPLPAGKSDIILGGSQLALQVHESCGHPIELDRVLGKEISYAGGSFLTLDKLGHFIYGSPEVTIVADATVPRGLGTFGYDDEGVPASKTYLINKGKLEGYLMSREDAVTLGLPSNGSARAENWNRIPLVRMTNVNLLPGKLELDELIGDIKEGLYFDTNKSWSIDDKRLNFQFGTEVAREIKNGKLGRIYKNAIYQGITPKFWKSCDGISDKKYWKVWGISDCGKGQPSQLMHVGHGTSPARFRKVKVGASQ